MSHTPWSQEQAEKWADEWMAIPLKGADACIPADEMFRGAFLMGLAKAAEMIEKSPTVYGSLRSKETIWNKVTCDADTHEAKLVGVRKIEGSEK